MIFLESIHKKIFLLACFLLFISLSFQSYAQAVVVGQVSFSRGTCAAQQQGEGARMLAKGADILVGDNIQTAERSFVILEFEDGAKVTVRPNSSFSVKDYNAKSGKETAKMELHIGGVRASTGEIANKRPDNFQINTALGAVNAKKAEYSVRLCKKDCAEENNRVEEKQSGGQFLAARIVEINGKGFAYNVNNNNQARVLAVGSPVFSKDRINTLNNSHAVLVFKDASRITLQADSEMDISQYSYQQEGTKDQALYKLVTGGMRVLTGGIAKTNREDFEVNTRVATIGIRGTGFDLHCENGCLSDLPNEEKPGEVEGGKGKGLYTHVWQGKIAQTNESGTFEMDTGTSSYIVNSQVQPVSLPEVPGFMQKNESPRPDKVDVKTETLFDTATEKTPSGLYVNVHDGQVEVEQITKSLQTAETPGRIRLDVGESSYMGDGDLVKLEKVQEFQTNDPYPSPSEFNEESAETGSYSLLQDNYQKTSGVEETEYQCTI